MEISKGSKQILGEGVGERAGTVPTAAETSGWPYWPLCQESHLGTCPTEIARKTEEVSGTKTFTTHFNVKD